MLTNLQVQEWIDAAGYFAKHGQLPALLSAVVMREIDNFPDTWEAEVRTGHYAWLAKAGYKAKLLPTTPAIVAILYDCWTVSKFNQTFSA